MYRCSSEVGMRGNGAQIMTLNENCYYNGDIVYRYGCYIHNNT